MYSWSYNTDLTGTNNCGQTVGPDYESRCLVDIEQVDSSLHDFICHAVSCMDGYTYLSDYFT